MGDFSTGDVLVTTNPFIFYVDSEDKIETGSRQDYPNPLRAIFDDLAPLLFESDPSTRPGAVTMAAAANVTGGTAIAGVTGTTRGVLNSTRGAGAFRAEISAQVVNANTASLSL